MARNYDEDEDERPSKHGAGNTTVTLLGSHGIVAAGAYIFSPDGFVVVKWLSSYLGAIGFVTLFFALLTAFGWYGTFSYFANEKHKDERRWNKRFVELRSDVKGAFEIVAALSEKITVLMERTRQGNGTRTTGPG